MPNETKCADAAGGIGNLVLYQMCEKWPRHTDIEHVADKILVVGRVYAAAPSRGLADKDGQTFTKQLARNLVEHPEMLDGKLDQLTNLGFPNCVATAVTLHGAFDNWIVCFSRRWREQKTGARQIHSRPSFASKYLHFHAPDVFPILDRYSELGLKELVGLSGSSKLSRYARFCAAFEKLVSLPEYANRSLRSIDTELVAIGRKIEAGKRPLKRKAKKGK